jgi:hypothetical protein
LSFKDGKLVNDEYHLDEVNAAVYKANKSMVALINQYEQPFAKNKN